MRREWTSGEVKALNELAPFGARVIADAIGRSIRSVDSKAQELGISLKTDHQTVAYILRIDHSDIRRHIEADLCPRCGQYPIGVKTTGLCGVCHRKLLAQAMRERRAIDEAQRELEAEKKAAQRRVACDCCGREYSPRKQRSLCPDCRGDA